MKRKITPTNKSSPKAVIFLDAILSRSSLFCAGYRKEINMPLSFSRSTSSRAGCRILSTISEVDGYST